MPILNASDITGLVTAVLDKYRRDDLTDLTTDVQEFYALGNLMQKNRMAWTGGEQYTFVYQDDTSGTARVTGLFDDDVVTVKDDLGTGRVPLRHFTCSAGWDKKEQQFNQGPARIVDHIKARKRAAILDMHKFMETEWWGKPPSSSDDDHLFGVDYWITYPATYSAAGFCGGNPSGFTSGAAGISSSSVPRWSNFYNEYTAVTFDDLGLKWIEAAMLCGFKPPVPGPGAQAGSKYGYYTNRDVMKELYRLIRSQNDDWGAAVDAGAGGDPLFRRTPVTWVPQLDSALSGDTDSRSDLAAYDPVYGINWSTFKFVFFRNEWMALTVRPDPNKHTCVNAFWDLTVNAVCTNRRPNFLLALGTLS